MGRPHARLREPARPPLTGRTQMEMIMTTLTICGGAATAFLGAWHDALRHRFRDRTVRPMPDIERLSDYMLRDVGLWRIAPTPRSGLDEAGQGSGRAR